MWAQALVCSHTMFVGMSFFNISYAIVMKLYTLSLHECRCARHKSPIDVKTTYLKLHLVKQFKARN